MTNRLFSNTQCVIFVVNQKNDKKAAQLNYYLIQIVIHQKILEQFIMINQLIVNFHSLGYYIILKFIRPSSSSSSSY